MPIHIKRFSPQKLSPRDVIYRRSLLPTVGKTKMPTFRPSVFPLLLSNAPGPANTRGVWQNRDGSGFRPNARASARDSLSLRKRTKVLAPRRGGTERRNINREIQIGPAPDLSRISGSGVRESGFGSAPRRRETIGCDSADNATC